MAIATSGITVLDPTTGPVAERGTRAPRPSSLEGKRIGFVDNSKLNSDRILQILDGLLRERYGVTSTIHRRKPTASRVIPPETLEEMRRACDLVVPGVGD